jgi:hypothetical protein
MTPVRYHQAAEDELLNEIGYLELRVPGLGRRFYADVRKPESLIAQFPESAQEVLPGIRKHTLRKFRFSLIYSIEKDGSSLRLLTTAVGLGIGFPASAKPKVSRKRAPDPLARTQAFGLAAFFDQPIRERFPNEEPQTPIHGAALLGWTYGGNDNETQPKAVSGSREKRLCGVRIELSGGSGRRLAAEERTTGVC